MTSLLELHRELNVSARLYACGDAAVRREHPDVAIERKELSSTDTEIAIHTPAGDQTIVWRRTPSSRRRILVKHEVETEQDLRVAAWREDHFSWEWDDGVFQSRLTGWEDLGVPAFTCVATPSGCYGPRVNIQDLFVNRMGVENGVYALADWPAAVEAFCEASNRAFSKLMRVLAGSPIEVVTFGDNIHSSIVSPSLFQRFILPEYQRRAEVLRRAGKFVFAHWDGNVRTLLHFARETGLDGIEAVTPQPQGDVTIEEIREGLGDGMFLMDGVPAIFFDETCPPRALMDCVRRLIETFAPRLILGISDEISATGDLERIRLVSDVVESYNARL